MTMLLLPLEVLLFRMNDRGRRQVVVLGGRRCRATVGERGYSRPSDPRDRGYMSPPPSGP